MSRSSPLDINNPGIAKFYSVGQGVAAVSERHPCSPKEFASWIEVNDYPVLMPNGDLKTYPDYQSALSAAKSLARSIEERGWTGMSYSVHGIAYDTRTDAMTAFIGEWVSAGGEKGIEEARAALDDSGTAREIIKHWGGDLSDGLGTHYATVDDLSEHMVNYRSDILAYAYGD